MAEGMQTRVIETVCHECILRVLWFYGDEDPRFDYVDVQLISNHVQRNHSRWRTRLRNAWSVMRDRFDWSGFQLVTADEAARFESAIREAIDETWPHTPRTGTL